MKRLAAVGLLFGSLLFCATAEAQTDSMIHVNQFPGVTVANKVANAQKMCPAAPVPCILVIDASLASAANGTMPTLCSGCSLWDFRNGVPNGLTLAAASFPGSDCGAKINTASSDFAGVPVTIEVNQACGTSAWSAVTLQAGQSLIFKQGGTYNVNTITLMGGNVVDLGNRYTNLWPLTASQSAIFVISGASLASPTQQIYIYGRGGILWEPFTPTSTARGISSSYGKYIHIYDLLINGFYDNIFLDNTSYFYFDHSESNGSTHSSFWAQTSDSSHGPYYSDNIQLTHSTFDSGSGTGAAVYLENVASARVLDNDVTGNAGQGIFFSSTWFATNGDMPADNVVSGNSVDSDASTAIEFSYQRDSVISKNWAGSGRINASPGINVSNSDSVAIIGNNAFWNGAGGVYLGSDKNIHMVGNTCDSNIGVGLHIVASTGTTVTANTFYNHVYNGSGGTQTYGIYEEPNSSGTTAVGNVAVGNTSGQYSFNGTAHGTLANDDGKVTVASINIGSATVPTVSTPTVGQAACIKAAGPPVLIGYCSTQPSAAGACTCN